MPCHVVCCQVLGRTVEHTKPSLLVNEFSHRFHKAKYIFCVIDVSMLFNIYDLNMIHYPSYAGWYNSSNVFQGRRYCSATS